MPSIEPRNLAPDATAPLDESVRNGHAPLIGIVTVGSEDYGSLERSVRGLAETAVLPGLHLCFVAPASLSSTQQVELQRIGHLLDGWRAWSVDLANSPMDFAASLREVAVRHPGADIIVIKPGAGLPFAWDARLRKAAYAASHISAVVPLCDIGPVHSLLDEATRTASRPDDALVDRTAYCMGDRSYYELPSLHAVCTYLRRDALDIALPLVTAGISEPQAVLDALTKLWRARGWSCVLCDYLYVGYSDSAAPIVHAGDGREERAFVLHHPLSGLRRAVSDVIRRGLLPVSVPGLDHRPVRLHVIHFWGGGLDKWIRDFGRADTSAINMILASFRIGEFGGTRLVLYSDPVALIPIRTWDIARPIDSTASSSLEYRRIVEQILAEFEIDTIIVSSLIGHALDALEQPRKTVVVCHDFYPICQAINPLFGKTCERCTLDDLRTCAKSNPLNRFFVGETSEEWHEMRRCYVDRLLTGRIEIVVPSPWVATTLKRLEPRLRGLPMHVIPHGIDLDVPKLAIPPHIASKPLRIVVLGRLSVHKGTELLRAASAELRPLAEITLLGCGKNGVTLAHECGWNSVERYEPEALPGLLKSFAPHAGLLASVVPETFSYTLSELIALGVPPLATALGSFNERIVDGESGFLFEPTRDALVGLVQRLQAKPELLAQVARNLATLACGRTTAEMVNDYRVLLPTDPRPIARFRVGVGQQSGLTEPYRHLTEAYGQLTDAYEQTRMAYEQTRTALEGFNSVWEPWTREFDALDITRRWWLAPKAARLVARLVMDLRKNMRALEQRPERTDEPADTPDRRTS